MSSGRDSDLADIGYKTKIGDYVEMVTPFGMSKLYRITSVTESKAIVAMPNRDALKFPRYYSLPYQPLLKKTKPDYESPNTWRVRMNSTILNKILSWERAEREA